MTGENSKTAEYTMSCTRDPLNLHSTMHTNMITLFWDTHPLKEKDLFYCRERKTQWLLRTAEYAMSCTRGSLNLHWILHCKIIMSGDSPSRKETDCLNSRWRKTQSQLSTQYRALMTPQICFELCTVKFSCCWEILRHSEGLYKLLTRKNTRPAEYAMSWTPSFLKSSLNCKQQNNHVVGKLSQHSKIRIC